LRKQGRAADRLWRAIGLFVAVAPGLWQAGTGQGVAFLLWIGASAVLGWGVTALFNAKR
jgi:hypothetical protein